MTRSPVFWLVLGAAGYWALQHFTGLGVSGQGKLSS